MSCGLFAFFLVLFALPISAGRRHASSFFQFLPDAHTELYNQISFDVAYNNVWQEIYTFPERRPRTFNVMVSTTKTWLADFVVQMGLVATKRMQAIDWRRSAAFAIMGFFYVGLLQWFFYVTVFTELCPHAIRFNEPISEKLLDHPGQIDLVKQICYDNFLFNPLIYFPVFYMIKESTTKTESCHLMSNSSHGVFGIAKAKAALDKYAANFVNDNLISSTVWIVGDAFVMAVPIFMRMPLEHAVGFFWTMLLSSMRGGGLNGSSSSSEEAAMQKAAEKGLPPIREEISVVE